MLSLYADGMASAEEARRVETHLPDCTACRESLIWTQAMQRALAMRPVVSPPADLRARIASAIAASSAAPVPASITVRRAFVVRPAYAAAASMTILGVVASYGLLHKPVSNTAHLVAPTPPMVATLPPVSPLPPIVKPATGPAVKSHVVRHPVAVSKPARLNPELMARVQPDESHPKPAIVKTPAAAGSTTKISAWSAPLMASAKPHVSAVKKPALPNFHSEMMATIKHSALSVKTHEPLVVQPEPKKPETVVATVPPVTIPVNVGSPSIKPDPAPTVVVATTHENRFHTADLLGPVKARLGAMQSFTHNTVRREAANGATYAMRTMDADKTPGIDFVHGPTH